MGFYSHPYPPPPPRIFPMIFHAILNVQLSPSSVATCFFPVLPILWTCLYIYIYKLICCKISFRFARYEISVKFREISPKVCFVTKQKNYISGKPNCLNPSIGGGAAPQYLLRSFKESEHSYQAYLQYFCALLRFGPVWLYVSKK